MIDIKSIKKLREETSISLEKCKEALEEAGGDIEKARDVLKKKGILEASKKEGRETKSGVVEAYIHLNKRVGVLIKLGCQTDFVAKNELFQELAHNLALHIAAMKPEYISEDDVPEEVKKELMEIYREELRDSKKPEKIINQIVEGKIKKRFSEICLLSQDYVKDPSIKVGDLIKSYISKFGENIVALDFARFEI